MQKRKLILLSIAICLMSTLFYPSTVNAGTPAGTITYSAGDDAITVNGSNSTHPANFEDIYNADAAGGWGQVTKTGSNQYYIECKLVIGSGSATYFADSNKQIVFTVSLAIETASGAHFRLGEIADATSKTGKNGCSLIFLMEGCTYFSGSSEMEFYGCSFYSNTAGAYMDARSSATYTQKFYSCTFDGVKLAGGGTIYFDVSQCHMRNVNSAIEYQSGLYNNNIMYNVTQAMEHRYSVPITVSGLQCYNHSYVGLFYNLSADVSLVNAAVDSWDFDWTGTSSGEVYRKYSFDLFVLNGDITDFVEGANCTLVHDGTVYASWLTNSTGQGDTQVLTFGYYNQTGGNSMYGGTPWTLTIEHPDWADYTSRFYIAEKMVLTVSMQEESSATSSNILAVALLAITGGFCFAFVVYAKRRE